MPILMKSLTKGTVILGETNYGLLWNFVVEGHFRTFIMVCLFQALILSEQKLRKMMSSSNLRLESVLIESF